MTTASFLERVFVRPGVAQPPPHRPSAAEAGPRLALVPGLRLSTRAAKSTPSARTDTALTAARRGGWIPTYELQARTVIHFAGRKQHYSLYPAARRDRRRHVLWQHAALSALEEVEASVGRDAVQPGTEQGPPFKALATAPGADHVSCTMSSASSNEPSISEQCTCS